MAAFSSTTQFLQKSSNTAYAYFTDDNLSNDEQGITIIGQTLAEIASRIPDSDSQKEAKLCELAEAYQTLRARYSPLPPLTHALFSQCSQFNEWASETVILQLGDSQATKGRNTAEIAEGAGQFSERTITKELSHAIGPFDGKAEIKLTLDFTSVNWTKAADLSDIGGTPSTFIRPSRVIIVPGDFQVSVAEKGEPVSTADITAWGNRHQMSADEAQKYFVVVNPPKTGDSIHTQTLQLPGYAAYKIIAQAGERNYSSDPLDNYSVRLRAEGQYTTSPVANKPTSSQPKSEIAQAIVSQMTTPNVSSVHVYLAVDGSGSMLGWGHQVSSQSDQVVEALVKKMENRGQATISMIAYCDDRVIPHGEITANLANTTEVQNLKTQLRALSNKASGSLNGGHETFWESVDQLIAEDKKDTTIVVVALTDGEFHSPENIDLEVVKNVLEKELAQPLNISHLESRGGLRTAPSPISKGEAKKQAFATLLEAAVRSMAAEPLADLMAIKDSLPAIVQQNIPPVLDYASWSAMALSYNDALGIYLSKRDAVLLVSLQKFQSDYFGGRDTQTSFTALLAQATPDVLLNLGYFFVSNGEVQGAMAVHDRLVQVSSNENLIKNLEMKIRTNFYDQLTADEKARLKLTSQTTAGIGLSSPRIGQFHNDYGSRSLGDASDNAFFDSDAYLKQASQGELPQAVEKALANYRGMTNDEVMVLLMLATEAVKKGYTGLVDQISEKLKPLHSAEAQWVLEMKSKYQGKFPKQVEPPPPKPEPEPKSVPYVALPKPAENQGDASVALRTFVELSVVLDFDVVGQIYHKNGDQIAGEIYDRLPELWPQLTRSELKHIETELKAKAEIEKRTSSLGSSGGYSHYGSYGRNYSVDYYYNRSKQGQLERVERALKTMAGMGTDPTALQNDADLKQQIHIFVLLADDKKIQDMLTYCRQLDNATLADMIEVESKK